VLVGETGVSCVVADTLDVCAGPPGVWGCSSPQLVVAIASPNKAAGLTSERRPNAAVVVGDVPVTRDIGTPYSFSRRKLEQSFNVCAGNEWPTRAVDNFVRDATRRLMVVRRLSLRGAVTDLMDVKTISTAWSRHGDLVTLTLSTYRSTLAPAPSA
jgi:hypothetical protein